MSRGGRGRGGFGRGGGFPSPMGKDVGGAPIKLNLSRTKEPMVLYPPNPKLPTPKDDFSANDMFMLKKSSHLKMKLKNSPYFFTPAAAKKDIERYSDKYTQSQSSQELLFSNIVASSGLFPSELIREKDRRELLVKQRQATQKRKLEEEQQMIQEPTTTSDGLDLILDADAMDVVSKRTRSEKEDVVIVAPPQKGRTKATAAKKKKEDEVEAKTTKGRKAKTKTEEEPEKPLTRRGRPPKATATSTTTTSTAASRAAVIDVDKVTPSSAAAAATTARRAQSVVRNRIITPKKDLEDPSLDTSLDLLDGKQEKDVTDLDLELNDIGLDESFSAPSEGNLEKLAQLEEKGEKTTTENPEEEVENMEDDEPEEDMDDDYTMGYWDDVEDDFNDDGGGDDDEPVF